ncbi:hypothetical protein PRIPAC_76731 [Pristionchus pacificus]|uniref:G protein-coupled receptor n=1 Tax=Pristionchus pacificus TaxID=54126 RepID=A0A2A6C2C3_PRIPA|nr:hypothetical protein PRIPAC_76731 [Pristionchus pacificus]|eukprot:PDM72382.1 G protein-coupled receptor [Pristionchus pacificus]
MNISRNELEISASTDSLYIGIFMSIGCISLPFNLLTIYLLAVHSNFYSREMRYLLINLQVQSCLQNFHFCILFTPVMFPSIGGGYCNGLLCLAGLPFHYCFTLFLFFTVLISAAFLIIVFARHQTLVAADCKLKLGKKARIGFYVLTHLVMLSIPLLFLIAASSPEKQLEYISNKYLAFLTWSKRGVNWSVISLADGDSFISVLIGSLVVNISLFGSVMLILLTHTIWIIARTYTLRSGRRLRGGWQSARIKNTIIVIIQLAIAVLMLLAPFVGMVTTVGKGIMAPVIETVLKMEVIFSFYSLANAMFFIFCNKQYNQWLRTRILRCWSKTGVQGLIPVIELETTEEPRTPNNPRGRFFRPLSPNKLSRSSDIFALTETWLTENDCDAFLLRGMTEYFVFRADRVDSRGGGVLIYAHSRMLPIPVSSLVIPGYESVKPDIPLSDHVGITVTVSFETVVKLPPTAPTRNFSLANWDIINAQIACHDWTRALSNKTATEAYCYFSNFLNSLLDDFVPLKPSKSSSGFPKFLSILHDRLQRLHSVAPNSDSTHSLRASTSSLPGIVDCSGAVLLTDQDKAIAFSKFFSKVQTPPMISPLPRSLPSNSSFDIPYISIEQILSAISQLAPKVNGSPDRIPNLVYTKCKLTIAWNMTLSAPKCAVLHLGRLKTRSKYVLNGCVISPKNEIRDLGVFFNSKLHFEHHIDQITRKARSMCNLMLRSFLTTSSDVLLKAYKIYIRPLLESSTVIWNPTAIGLVNKLESVQREFTRRIFWRSHLSQSSYPQRLEHFKLETLEYRRALNDMYFLFDSAHGFVHLDTSNIYSIAPLSRTLRSSHRLRLTIPFLMPSSLSTFASRPLTLWNSLSSPIVTLPRIPYRNHIRRTPSLVLPVSQIKLEFGPEFCYRCHLVMLHLIFHSLFLIAFSFWYRYTVLIKPAPSSLTVQIVMIILFLPNALPMIFSIFARDDPVKSREILQLIYPTMDLNSTTHRSVNFSDPFSAPTDYSAIFGPFVVYTFVVVMRRKALTYHAILPSTICIGMASFYFQVIGVRNSLIDGMIFIFACIPAVFNPILTLYFVAPYRKRILIVIGRAQISTVSAVNTSFIISVDRLSSQSNQYSLTNNSLPLPLPFTFTSSPLRVWSSSSTMSAEGEEEEPALPQHDLGKWRVLRNIASGPFSDVFIVSDIYDSRQKYAIKVEKQHGNIRAVLKLDVMVLSCMQRRNAIGFPRMIAAGRTSAYKYLVMQMLGPGKLRRSLPEKQFSLATALKVALQTVDRLHALHDARWLCRDAEGNCIPPRASAALVGTFQYAPLAAHAHKDQSPKDDLESWFYLHDHRTHQGSTSMWWIQGLSPDGRLQTSNQKRADFLSGCPEELGTIMDSIDRTQFFEEPEYELISRELRSAAARADDLEMPFDWQINRWMLRRAHFVGDLGESNMASERIANATTADEDAERFSLPVDTTPPLDSR